MTSTVPTVDARDLSCQGLTQVDPDVLTFHGDPVTGWAEEVQRRGHGHVYGCSLIGHGITHDATGGIS